MKRRSPVIYVLARERSGKSIDGRRKELDEKILRSTLQKNLLSSSATS
jgi:hypothetical protein